jgi:Domain of unknown function (DUF4062)
MASPRVFISSTCYDLKHIRENLKYLIKTIGYDPILSEEGGVFYDPKLHTEDACLAEIPNCQLFILIIGGRFGSKSIKGGHSITNSEYKEAVQLKIPVFALVEQAVRNDFQVFLKNRENEQIDADKIIYPSVDNAKIFNFIEEVSNHSVNNALVPFRDFSDIESYLRQQWAGMMFQFLLKQNEESRVVDTLTALGDMNVRIEMLSKQILRSVGTETAKLDALLYEEMLTSDPIRDLIYWKLRPTPASILINSTFRSCAESLGKKPKPIVTDEFSISTSGEIEKGRFELDSRNYKNLRQRLIDILKEHNLTSEKYIKS